MVKKILKYFLILFFSTIIAFFVYLTFNSEFRRNFLTYSIAGYKYYQKILIKSSLPDVKKASDQLIKFVKVSDYLSSYGKNSFLVSVYQNAKIIEEKISSEEDYLYFSEVVNILTKKDPDLYDSKIWQIKIAIIKKDEDKKITELINSAVTLAPAREEAYRIAFSYYSKNNKKNLLNNLCRKYHNLNLGGSTSQYVQPNFYGYTFSKFALETFPTTEDKKYYVKEGISFNESQDYIFSLPGPTKLNALNIHLGSLPGAMIEIEEIKILDNENLKTKLEINDLLIFTNSSYFKNDSGKITVLGFSESNEVININLKKDYKNITQIKLRLKFSRLELTNNKKC